MTLDEELDTTIADAKRADMLSADANGAADRARAKYLEDPEVVAAFAVLKRKQGIYGVDVADKAAAAARRAAWKIWNRVDDLLPDPDYE